MTLPATMEAGILLYSGHGEQARQLLSATSTGDPAASADGSEQAATTVRLTSALVDAIVTLRTGPPSDAIDQSAALASEARRCGRSAWAAAAGAVTASALLASGQLDSAIAALAQAEIELAQERALPEPLDPVPGPTGPGAAANNLGVAYVNLGLLAMAEPHLVAAAEASRYAYGPEYAGQAAVDAANVIELHLTRAAELEEAGDADGARRRAETGLALVADAQALSRDSCWPTMTDFIHVLELGCRSFAAPMSVTPDDALRLRALIETSSGSLLFDEAVVWTILTRVYRLAGDPAGAAWAAGHFAVSGPVPNVVMVWTGLREAMLAEGGETAAGHAYASALRSWIHANRNAAADSLRRRIDFVRLERSHAEVNAARERLEAALAAARAEEAGLLTAAARDPLTGLLNREAFRARLAEVLGAPRTPGGYIAVVFIDLDGFKQVNDEHGHLAGDEVLVHVAHAMSSGLRETDTLARIGGDEFMCLLHLVRDRREAEELSARLIALISAVETPHGTHISASAGVCLVDAAATVDTDEVVQLADAAMYRAKRRGGGQTEVTVNR